MIVLKQACKVIILVDAWATALCKRLNRIAEPIALAYKVVDDHVPCKANAGVTGETFCSI